MITFKELDEKYFDQVIKFTDKYIGLNYFSRENIEEIFNQSKTSFGSTSFLAFDDDELIATRLTRNHNYNWEENKKTKKELWKVPVELTAYFQSLFIKDGYQGQGLGAILSQMSIDRLKQSGAKAIVCHCMKESPNNSSFKYLSSLGFVEVEEFKNYWQEIDYFCTNCQENPCKCTALEMILYL